MEILIVLFVVGIMISGIVPLFLNVITANKSTAYYSTAYRLSDSKIEELRSAPFENIDVAAGTYDANNMTELADLPSGQMIIAVSDEVNGSNETKIRQIEVTINWNFKTARSHTVSTLITEGGIGR